MSDGIYVATLIDECRVSWYVDDEASSFDVRRLEPDQVNLDAIYRGDVWIVVPGAILPANTTPEGITRWRFFQSYMLRFDDWTVFAQLRTADTEGLFFGGQDWLSSVQALTWRELHRQYCPCVAGNAAQMGGNR